MAIKFGEIELYEDQEIALNKLSSGNVLVGGVGSGKTFVSIFWYLKNYPDRPLLVITTPSARDMVKKGHTKPDWHESIEACGISEDRYMVDSWNNIEKYKKVRDACIIFDEQRAIGYGKWARTFIYLARFNNNAWIMTSATPGDVWMDYVPLFCANGFYKHKTDFCNQHVIWNPHVKFPAVQRYVGTGRLNALREQILVKMNDKRKTVRHKSVKRAYYNVDKYNLIVKERFNYDTGMPIQNASEFTHCLRRIVNTSPTRAILLLELTERYDRIIVFYNYTYEYEMIVEQAEKIGMKWAAWNRMKHENVPTGDKWWYIVQYNAAEAWNCITTNCMVFWSLNSSYRKMEQAEGRIDRLNTSYKDLYYYYFLSDAVIDKRIMVAIENKKAFNNSAFAKKYYGLEFSKEKTNESKTN